MIKPSCVCAFGAGHEFTLEEAFGLFNAHARRKTRPAGAGKLDGLGFVAGVVTLNDQVEFLIKFEGELLQLNKRGATDLIQILPDD